MRGKRMIFAGAAALLAVAGFLGINVYSWWVSQPDASRSSADRVSRTASPEANPHYAPPFSSSWPIAELEESHDHAIHEEAEQIPTIGYFPEHAETTEVAQADHPEPGASQAGESAEPAPPRLLPDAQAPLVEPAKDDWLSQLVKRELPNANAEEVRVWSEKLKGLDPQTACEILRLRKDIGNRPLPGIGMIREPAPAWNDFPEADSEKNDRLVPPPLDELPAVDKSLADSLRPSIKAYEKARGVILHNLANAHTPGFKRLRVVLSSKNDADDTAEPVVNSHQGVELAGTLVDVSQGPLKITGQPLDLAIDGPGFFQVRVGEDVLYTRAGMGAVDETGRLGLICGGKLRPLEPPVRVSPDSVLLDFTEVGTVKTIVENPDEGEAEERESGQVQLARFINPSGLESQSGQLFAATKSSGSAKTGAPGSRGLGKIRQGRLEESNVSRDDELEAFYRIQSHGQLLKQLSASPDERVPPGPIARRPVIRAKSASAVGSPLALPALNSIKKLRERGGSLIDEYLQSQRVKSLKRNLGFN